MLFFAGPGGVAQDGTFAEMTSVPSRNLAPLPGEIPDEIAGGLPVAYLSAFLALRQAGFREGQSVLAPGVGGSVGNATLKVARALGASQLVSTAGSSAKEAAAAADGGLRQVGIVNLQRENLADGLARLAPRGVDIVIDALGGPLTGQAVGGLARGGRVVVMGYAAGTETTMRVTDLVWKLAHVSGFSLFAASADEQAEAYTAVLPLIAGRPDRARPRPVLPARAGPRGAAPPDRGPAVRRGDPDCGRLIRPLIPVLKPVARTTGPCSPAQSDLR